MCLALMVSMVRLRREGQKVELIQTKTITHEGNPRKTMIEALENIPDVRQLPIVVTGRKFISFLNLTTISEPEAVEHSVAHLMNGNLKYRVVVSVGATFLVYHLDDDGTIQGIQTGNNRLGHRRILSAADTQDEPDHPPSLGAGHLGASAQGFRQMLGILQERLDRSLNKGIPKGQVVAGLAQMMACKVVELLKKLPKKSVMLVGGSSQNHTMMHYLGKEIEDLVIPEELPTSRPWEPPSGHLTTKRSPIVGAVRSFRKRALLSGTFKPFAEFQHLVQFKIRPRGTARAGRDNPGIGRGFHDHQGRDHALQRQAYPRG